MITVGIIGLGFMGRTHLGAYRTIPGVRIGAVASPGEAGVVELAAEVGATHHTESSQLLADPSIDAVSITVPTHLHREIALAAMEAGKHVLIEKPLGLTVADCEAIEARAANFDGVVMVGHVLRYWPAYVKLVEVVRSGRIGAPKGAFAERLSSPPRWSSWLGDPELSGGAVHDFHIHDLDALNWIFGNPLTVQAVGARGTGGGWDQILTQIRYGTGPEAPWAIASANSMLPPGSPFTARLRVICEDGAIEMTNVFGGDRVDSGSGHLGLHLYSGDGHVQEVPVEDTRDPYLIEVAAFVGTIRAGGGKVHLDSGGEAVRTALAVRRALDTGVPVPVAASTDTAEPEATMLAGAMHRG